MIKRNQRLENSIYYGAKAKTLEKTHDQKEYDMNRSADPENLGIEVIRITNEEAESDIEKVLKIIENKIKTITPSKSDTKRSAGV